MACIYKIVNKVNGKFYVGSTSRPKYIRKYEHLSSLRLGSHPNSYLQRSFNKYKEESFEFQVIEGFKFPNDYEKEYINEYLVSREFYWVSILNPEYNIKRDIERGKTGYIHSKETRQKISIANKGKGIGRKLSEETRRRISESNMGRIFSIETREKIASKQRGRTFSHTSEAIEKISERARKEDNRQRIRDIQKISSTARIGSHHSKEFKLKMLQTKYGVERVIQIFKDDKLIYQCDLQKEASELTGVKRSNISNNLSGISKSAGGYAFKYKEV